MSEKKIVGITMGDPASIGPEITVKAFADKSLYDLCNPVVVGDASVMEAALPVVGHTEMKINAIKDVSEAKYEYGTIDVLDMGLVDMAQLKRGEVSAMCGDAAFKYVTKVIELAMDKKVDATVTNAFNKEAVNLAGHHYSGHTEIYADMTGTKNYTMMLAHENLRVVHVSTHVALREACDRVKKQRVLDVIRIADKACRDLGIKEPKIGVAGLNPHSGEHGLFGMEEVEEVAPAVEELKKMGYNVAGPISADSVFHQALQGRYNCVLSLYHDQGHIATKTLDFEKTIAITCGMPILRTSVDHGTAFDIAGKNIVSEVSMAEAIIIAAKYAPNFAA